MYNIEPNHLQKETYVSLFIMRWFPSVKVKELGYTLIA